MAEKSLNLALSGEEIIESVCFKVAEAMRRDCFLSPNSAYEWYRAEVTVKVFMNDIGRVSESEFHVKQEGGAKGVGNPQMVKAEFKIDEAAPNEVRQEAGLPIPVLTANQGTGRPEIKAVSYRKPGTFTR